MERGDIPLGFDETIGHGTQIRCAHCPQGWVTLDGQEDVPAVSYKKCEACLRKSNSHRAERRDQEPKPRGRPPKKKSNRGRKPKVNIRERFGDSLHVTAHVDQGGTEGDEDGDEQAAPPPVPQPATRAWGRPPKQRPIAGGRQTAEPSPALPTRLPTRHTRRGSELAPPPKRPKPLHNVASVLAPTAVPRGGTERDDDLDGREEEEGVERKDDEEEEDESGEEEGDEEGSPTRRNDDPSTRVARRGNRVTSRGRSRATNIETAPQETPRRRLRSRSVRNPSFTPRRTPTPAAQDKPKYYNSE